MVSQIEMRINAALAMMLVALVSLPALAQTPVDRTAYWHPGWGLGWGHMIFGSLMMILFWGGIILAIFLAVRWIGSHQSQGRGPIPRGNRALDILQERFARGEIDKDEFEERKRLLSE